VVARHTRIDPLVSAAIAATALTHLIASPIDRWTAVVVGAFTQPFGAMPGLPSWRVHTAERELATRSNIPR